MQWGGGSGWLPRATAEKCDGAAAQEQVGGPALQPGGGFREAHLHLRSAMRAEGGPAAPGETRGAVATAGLWSGGPGAQSGARFGAVDSDKRWLGLGHSGGDTALGGVAVCGNGRGTRAESPEAQTCSASQGGRNTQRKKTGTWTYLSLENALNSITDDGMSIREASKLYGIPSSSIRDHLYGRTTSR